MTNDKKNSTDNKPSQPLNKAENDSQTENASTHSAETSTPDQPELQEPQKAKQPGKKKWVLLIIVIALLLGAFNYYLYLCLKNNQTQQLETLEQKFAQQEQQLSSQLQQKEQQWQQRIEQQNTLIKQQDNSIESLQSALADVQGRRPNDWLLSEADYLVKLASRKLFLEHDPVTATELVESADQRIASLNDPSLVPLRRLMATDITRLKSIPIIDHDGLILKLMSLQQQVDLLPLANAILPPQEEQAKDQMTDSIDNWQHNLRTSLKEFADNFITFRTRDGSATPLLSPEQHFYLRENIQAKIETAIHSVNDESGDIYQSALNTVVQWSKQYFNQTSPAVIAFQKDISELANKDITTNYPDEIVSAPKLEDTIRQRIRRAVTPVSALPNKESAQ